MSVKQVTSMEQAARLYRKIESRLEEKQKEFDQACAKDRAALEQLELGMLQFLREAGVSTMNVPGVAEVKISNKRVFGCADWDLFMTWVVKEDKPELLQKRIHEGNMQQWIDDHGGAELPPAVNVHTQAVLKVLKGKA